MSEESKAIPGSQARDFEVLYRADRPYMALRDCFHAKLAAVAVAECGGNVPAAVTLGVHETTVLLWKRWGKRDRVTALPAEVQEAIDRLVAELWVQQKSAHELFLNFREGLAQAALTVSGNRQAAAVRLRVSPLSLRRWRDRVVQSKTPRRNA